MSERHLPLVIKISGHPDIEITVPAQDSVDITVASPTGQDLAMLTLSNIESPTAILGHWPDGEEWVDEGDVPLGEAPLLYTVHATRTVSYEREVRASSYEQAVQIANRADFDLGEGQYLKDWDITIESEDE